MRAMQAGRALAILSSAVLLASATWFTGTAVAPQLALEWQLGPGGSAWLTSSVQLGFIAGTFAFAVLNLADRHDPRNVFAWSAAAGAIANAAFALLAADPTAASLCRFATGFALAGVYPVGMKIVASWSPGGLGLQLGIMVGALVGGTSLPYLVRWAGLGLDWRAVVLAGSAAAIAGALLVRGALPEGPRLQARAALAPRMFLRVFRDQRFRWNSCGYFGHMWELYALWALVPFALQPALGDGGDAALLSFGVVASGVAGCVLGGVASRRIGERRVALLALAGSATCCAGSGLIFGLSPPLLVPLALLWGFCAVADSPQFSALAARYCPPEYTGTALTIQNGIGFAITVAAIQCTAAFAELVGWHWAFVLLAPGPMFGAYAMLRLGRR
jgi:MFS family permease